MINIELTQQLENHVKKVVELVRSLRKENQLLKEKIAEIELKINTLQQANSNQQNNEEQVEAGIKGVLNILTELDELTQTENTSSVPHSEIDNGSPESTEQNSQSENSQSGPSLGEWHTLNEPTVTNEEKTEPDGTTQKNPESEWNNTFDDKMVNIPPPPPEKPEESMDNDNSEQNELDIF